MASILDLLNTQTGKDLVNKASETTSESPEKISSVLAMAMPLILASMKKNVQAKEGAENLNKALHSEKHNGELLNHLREVPASEMINEGDKILSHILGGKKDGISNSLGTALNMDGASADKILKMAAPVIMSLLGNQKRKDNVGAGGLESLLGSVLGKQSKHDSSLITSLLDADGDGSVIDDVAGMVFGSRSGKKKGGGLLGGMLGGK